MQIKAGKQLILQGNSKRLNKQLWRCAQSLAKQHNVLFITSHSLPPPPHCYRKLHRIHVTSPYELWHILLTLDHYIRNNHIDLLYITPLNNLFKTSQTQEIRPLLRHLTHTIAKLTKKYHLATKIGVDTVQKQNNQLASNYILRRTTALKKCLYNP